MDDPEITVDNKGNICKVDNLNENGCCNVNIVYSFACYECELGNDEICCSRYEMCVNCCNSPNKQAILLEKLDSETDQFDYCRFLCLTRAKSLESYREKFYRNAEKKYCFP